MTIKRRVEALEQLKRAPQQIFVTVPEHMTQAEIDAARERAKIDPDFIFIEVVYEDSKP